MPFPGAGLVLLRPTHGGTSESDTSRAQPERLPEDEI